MNKIEPHVQEWKKKEVKEIARLFNEYPVIGVINLQNLPALQCMKIRKSLKDVMFTKMTKRRLIIKAIETELKDKPNVNELLQHLKGMPSLVFSKENPFSLYKKISKNKSSAAAKPGQIAPNDLGVEAGPTPFVPGPIIGELGKLGLKTEVKEGKIHLKEAKILVKEGEEITSEVAELLAKLGVEPMEIGLNLVATYENGEILDKRVFGIDEKEFMDNIKLAASEARSLAVFIEYPDPEILELVIKKAEVQGKALAQKANFETGAVKVEEKPAEVKEEPKPEPVKEEVKPEEPKVEEPKEEPKPAEVKEVEKPEASPGPTPDKPPPEPEPHPEPEPKPPEPEPVPEPPQEDKLAKEVKAAQDVLKNLQDEALKGKIPTASELAENKEKFKNKNKDVKDIINDLKDKKSRGEI